MTDGNGSLESNGLTISTGARRLAVGVVVGAVLGGCAGSGRHPDPLAHQTSTSVKAVSRGDPSSRKITTTTTPRLVSQAYVIGTSVRGRRIRAVEVGNPDAAFKVVVVGCIHGDEPAGIAIARQLAAQRGDGSVDLWVIDDLNPDGVAAETRQNANAVDLNRNFPYSWRPVGHPGGDQYSGTGPLSEPEARAAAAFLDRVRPSVTIWFHQHADLVDDSGGDPVVERRFAQTIGLPFMRLTRYPGSVASWENHRYLNSTAFVVELPAGPGTPSLTQRALAAIHELHTHA